LKKTLLFSLALLFSSKALSIEIDFDTEDFYVIEANKTELHEGLSLFVLEDKYFFPIKSFLNSLNIEFSSKDNTHSGWVFDKKTTFSITLNQSNSFNYQGTAYFDAKDFCQQLGIEFNDIEDDGLLRLKSKNMFAYEQKNKLKNQSVKNRREIIQTDIPHQYHEFTAPSFKFDTNLTFNDESDEQSASISYKGDVGFTSLSMNAYADNDDVNLNTIKVSKIGDPNTTGLYFTSFQIGDIYTSSNHHVTNSIRGTGFALYRKKEDTNPFHNKENIAGYYKPNYTVELYQNDILVDTSKTDEYGHYRFKNNPLFIGQNTFTLKFYGDHGDIYEETRKLTVTGDMLKKNDHKLNVHFLDTGRTIGGEILTNKGHLINFDYAFGFTSTLTYGFGLTKLFNDDANLYATNSITYTNGGTSNNIELITDGADWGGTISSLGIIQGVNYSLYASKYTEDFLFENEEQRDRMSFLASKYIGLDNKYIKSINLIYNVKRTTDAFTTFTNQKFGVSASFNDFNARYYLDTTDTLKTHEVKLTTSVKGYRIKYELSQNSIKQNHLFELNKRIYGYNFRVKSEFDKKNNSESYSLNIDKHIDELSIRAYTSYSNGNTEFGLNLSTNIFWDEKPKFTRKPLMNSGSIETIAFIDENYNDIKDPLEPPIANIKYKSHTLWKNIRSAVNGKAILPGISHLADKLIYVDVDSIEDFSLLPPKDKYVQVHAGGVTKVLMPFKRKKILEFNLFDEDGISIKYAKINITSNKQNITGFTDSEGYYFSESIFPGEITISLSENKQINTKVSIPYDKDVEEYYFDKLVFPSL
jgi:hypothetical protein